MLMAAWGRGMLSQVRGWSTVSLATSDTYVHNIKKQTV